MLQVVSRTVILCAVLAAIFGALVGLAPVPCKAVDSVKIGVLLPLTGPVADIGRNTRQGMIWAADRINAAGGIKALGNARIELVFGDSESDPKVGMTELQKLITVDNVPVLTGAYQSGVTLPTAGLAERYRVPYLVFSSISDSITEQGYHYVFRPHSPSSMWATVQFDFLDWLNKEYSKELGSIKNVAFLYENTEYGQSTAKSWRVEAEKRGYKVVSDLPYPHAATDLTSTVNRLKAASPDAVLMVSYVSDAILLAKTMRELDFWPRVQVGTGGGHSDPAFLNSGVNLNGVYSVANWNRDIKRDINEVFWNEYIAKWKTQPSSHSAQGVMNIYVLKEVLEQAGSVDREAIEKALRNYSSTNSPPIMSGADKIAFDEKGQSPYPEIILTQIQNGVFRTVFPARVAAAKPLMPDK